MKQIEAVARITKQDKPASAQKRGPFGLAGNAVNEGGESGGKKPRGKHGIRNPWREQNNTQKPCSAKNNQRGGGLRCTAASKKKAAGQHAHEKFRQANQRIEAENIFPEEIRFAGVHFVQAVRMKENIAQRKTKADEPKTSQR